MEQLVRVRKLNDDGTAQVICIRESACSGDCHKCSGCGAVQQKLLFTARNPIGAQPGDQVVVETDTGPVLLAALMLYMVPLVLFLVGYLVCHALWGLGGLGGCLAFGLGILGAVLYDRCVAKKRSTEYTITRFGHT